MSTPIARSLIWLTIAEILFTLSGYIIHAVAGRILGPADYGRYGLVVTFTTTVIILIGNGIPTAMSRYLSEHFEHAPEMVSIIKRTSARLQMILIGAITVIFFLVSPLIAALLGDPSLTPLFRLSSLILPAFAASSFYFYYFTGIHLFHYQAILKMVRSVLRIIIIVSLVIFFKITGAITGYIIVPFLTFLLGAFFDWKTGAPFVAQDKTRSFSWQKLLASAWPITLFLLFYEIFISIDLYLVKSILADDTQTGLYNAALTLGRIPYYLFYALSIVLLPSLAKLKNANDPEKVNQLMSQSLRYAGIILLPVFILIASYAQPLIELFFGSKFSDGADTLRILTFGLSFLTIFYVICMGLIGLGRAHLAMWIAIVGTGVNALCNALLIPKFGIEGAAWATTITATLTTVATLLIMQLYIPLSYRFVPIAKTVFATVVLAFGAYLFPSSSSYFIFPASVLGCGYFAFLFFLRVLTKKDLVAFKEIFPSKQTL